MALTYTPNINLAMQQDKHDKLNWDAITANWQKIDTAIGSGGGGGSALDYSTSEQNTGRKWIDGKDIYCITFDRSEHPVGSRGTIADASNIDILIAAAVTTESDGIMAVIGTGGRGVYIYNNNLIYYTAEVGMMLYCTIWYTKLAANEQRRVFYSDERSDSKSSGSSTDKSSDSSNDSQEDVSV